MNGVYDARDLASSQNGNGKVADARDEPPAMRPGANTLLLFDSEDDARIIRAAIPAATTWTFAEILRRSEDELREVLGLTVVGVLPQTPGPNLLARARDAREKAKALTEDVQFICCPTWTADGSPIIVPYSLKTPAATLAWLINGIAADLKPDDHEEAYDYLKASDDELGVVDASSVTPENPEWLWEGRFLRGKLNLITGEGGDGKTTIAIAVAAAVSRGGAMPDGSPLGRKGKVAILAAEDAPGDVLVPRLIAAGADRRMIKFLKAEVTIRKKGNRPALIDTASLQNLVYWRTVFDRHKFDLLIVDPLPAYLGRGVNDHKNAEVQAVLNRFVSLAAEFKVAVIGISHTGKARDLKLVHRVLGSVAYTNCARVVHVTVKDPEDDTRRYLARPKCNLDEPRLPLAYKLVSCEASEAGMTIKTARVEFDPDPVAVDVENIASGKSPSPRGPEPRKTMALAEWLFDFLEQRGIPTPLGAVFDGAGSAGFLGKKRPDGKWSSAALLYQAKDRIPSLTGHREGKKVDAITAAIGSRGREVVHWSLIGLDSAF